MDYKNTLYAFNRGVVSPLALARQDLKRMALSAETQTNWMPRTLGATMLRPGTRHIYSRDTGGASNLMLYIPFEFSASQTALLEMTANEMRVVVDDALVTIPSVSTVIADSGFAATPSDLQNPTDWTVWSRWSTQGANGAATQPEAGAGTGNQLELIGTGTASAIVDQKVTIAGVAGVDQNTEHFLDISVTQGEVTLSVGRTRGGTEILGDILLREGVHKIAFDPDGYDYVYVRLRALKRYASKVDYCKIATSGFLALATPWGNSDLRNVRWEQSGDVLFIACAGVQPYRIERNLSSVTSHSWSAVKYLPEDGPFRSMNTTNISLASSGTNYGSPGLAASAPFFTTNHVGALFKLESRGQFSSMVVNDAQSSKGSFSTDFIKISGSTAANERDFYLSVIKESASNLSGYVHIERSFGVPGDWSIYASVSIGSAAASGTFVSDWAVKNDGLTNQLVYYRATVRQHLNATTGISSGQARVEISTKQGYQTGIVRVTAFTNSTSVEIDVLKELGASAYTSSAEKMGSDTVDWYASLWSPARGWPSCVALHDGRLWWAGGATITGSVSDDYSSFDSSVEGDSGPVKRSIGRGPVETIHWMVPLTTLLLGGDSVEWSVRSNAIDEPITPTACGVRPASTIGSKSAIAVRLDNSVIFVQRCGSRVYELVSDSSSYTGYAASDLTAIAPDIGSPGIVRIAVQRQPDTRIHCVRSDGKVAILVYDRLEKTTCWVLYETDGTVEDVVVLPGTTEDAVYYVVNRTYYVHPNTLTTYRFLERWALESEGQGGAVTILSDSTVTGTVGTGGSAGIISGLASLANKTVVVWAGSAFAGTYLVSTAGLITGVPAAYSGMTAYVGIPYTATFKSTRLALGSQSGNPLTQRQRLSQVGLVLYNTHYQGLKYGQDVDHLDDLPPIERDAVVDSSWTTYSEDAVPLNGTWSTDNRLILQAESPKPCTVLAAVISGAGHDK